MLLALLFPVTLYTSSSWTCLRLRAVAQFYVQGQDSSPADRKPIQKCVRDAVIYHYRALS